MFMQERMVYVIVFLLELLYVVMLCSSLASGVILKLDPVFS